MKRVLTAAVILPLVLGAVFWLPSGGFLWVVAVAVGLAVFEYVRLVKAGGAGRAAGVAYLALPLAMVLCLGLPEASGLDTFEILLAAFVLAGALAAVAALFSRDSLHQQLLAVGAASFGVAYFTAAIAGLYKLHEMGPWVLILLFAVVWFGDSAALYAGRLWGRAKLAPVVSPNKTWVGAAASLLSAVAAAAGWSAWRLGGVEPKLLLAAAVVSVAAQVGDLVESMLKRGVGVKDSGNLLPGHGGMLDRLDALLVAAPVFVLLIHLLGLELF